MTKLLDFYHSPTEWEKKSPVDDKWYVGGKPFTHTLFHDEGDVKTLPPDAKLVRVGGPGDVKKNLKKFYFSKSQCKWLHEVNFAFDGYSGNTYVNGMLYTECCSAEVEPLTGKEDNILLLTESWDEIKFHYERIYMDGLRPLPHEDAFDYNDYDEDADFDQRRFDDAWPEDLNNEDDESGDKFDEDV